MQRAILFPAQQVTVLVNMAENVIEALFSDNILCSPTGNSLGRLVPVDDGSVQITNVGPIAQRVDYCVHVEIGQVFHSVPPKYRHKERAITCTGHTSVPQQHTQMRKTAR
jgi:hypothetical protein